MIDRAAQSETKLPLLAGLDDSTRQRFMALSRRQELERGTLLCMHGEPLGKVFFVLEGAVRTFRQTPDGKEITVGLALPGDMLGSEYLAEGFSHYQWSAMACEPHTVVLGCERQVLRQVLREEAALALNLLAQLAEQTYRATVDADQLVTFTAPQRVACFLLRLCALYGFDPQRFNLPFAKATIASKLGMEVETFSRSLAKLKEYGVEVAGRKISLGEMRALECYACGHCSTGEDCATLAKLHASCGGKP